MRTITLNIKNTNDYQLLLQLVKRLGIKLLEKGEDVPEESGVKMAKALEKLLSMGGFKSIPDPAAWQRRTRKDRNLI